ncbi:MAG: DeoR family transcriptional regulator [Minisyncoccales bacterium]
MDKNTLTTLAEDIYRLTILFPAREPLRYKMREIADDIIAKFVMENNGYLDDLKRLLEVMDDYFQIAVLQDWVSPAKINELKNDYARIAPALDEIEISRQEARNVLEKQKSQSGGSKAAVADFELADAGRMDARIICPLPKSVEPRPSSAPMIVPESVLPATDNSGNESQTGVTAKGETVEIVSVSKAAREIKSPSEEESGSDDDDDEDDRGGLTSGQIARQNRITEFLKENGSAQVWEILKIFPTISKRTIRRDFRSMLKQGLIERTGERNTTAYKLKINIS